MDLWFYLLASICLYLSLQALLNLLFHKSKKLPPGPPTIPILGNIFWLLKSSKNFADVVPALRQLRSQYGPIVTLYIGSRPAIFITTPKTAHQALVKSSSIFAGRPEALETIKIIFPNDINIASSPYGSIWRFLRQNLMQVIHPARLKSYSHCRKFAKDVLNTHLLAEIESAGNKGINVKDHFQYAMYALISFMCFGEKFDDRTIRDVKAAQQALIHNFIRFNVLNFAPFLTKIVFRKMWMELLDIKSNQISVLLSLIQARQEKLKKKIGEGDNEENMLAYVDTLFDVELPDTGRKLSDEELVSLCSEFLIGGTDTSATTLLWVMANLVKHQDIQEKLFDEINGVVKVDEDINEENMKKMPYLKAVVLETMRRHPPGHFILPRAVTEDTVMNGYDIPKDAMVNFTVAEIGWDSQVWEDPMEFKPERFLSDHDQQKEFVFDLKGVKEVKMMPFGAGRRVCPAITLSLLHLEFFVANLVRGFKWTLEDGCEVDMSEKQAFTIVMKNPIRPCLCPRIVS